MKTIHPARGRWASAVAGLLVLGAACTQTQNGAQARRRTSPERHHIRWRGGPPIGLTPRHERAQ